MFHPDTMLAQRSTVRVCLLKTGSPAKSLSTKTVILSACSCLRNRRAALVFPTRYRAARFSGTKSNSRGTLILWVKCFAVSARSNLSWQSMKVSYKQICILLHLLYSESDSVFRLTPVCLAISLVVYSLFSCSHCILIH